MIHTLFMTNNVILMEGNLVENEPLVVADLNDYFVNIVKDIGSPDNNYIEAQNLRPYQIYK